MKNIKPWRKKLKIPEDERLPIFMDSQNWCYENSYLKQSMCSMESSSKSQFHSSQNRKSIIKFMWKHKRHWIFKVILSKKTNDGGITIPDFKLQYRAIGKTNKQKWYWLKNRHEDQWNRTEVQNINPHSYSLLSFDKDVKNTHWRTYIQIMVVGNCFIHMGGDWN
jgi:hypothetical protein